MVSTGSNDKAAAALNLDGVSVALVTPWANDQSPDLDVTQRLVQRVVDAGVVGVCPAGTTGEGPRLTAEQRVRLTRLCAEITPSSVAVVAGVVPSSIVEALTELEAFAAVGADAALATPPLRLPLDDAGCAEWFTALADRSALPLILYHIPQLTGIHLSAAMTVELLAHPGIIGLKDSSRDLEHLLAVIDGQTASAGAEDDAALLTGTDTMLVACLRAGATGTIAASANLVPELGVALHRAVRAGDWAEADALQIHLRAVVGACRRGTMPAGWKAALELDGRCPATLVPPGQPLDEESRTALRADLKRLKVLT